MKVEQVRQISNAESQIAAVIHCCNLVKEYEQGSGKRTIVDDVSLGVHPGEIVAILGPSGSGKTTLLNMIAGLVAPDSGSIFIRGTDISKLSQNARAKMRAKEIGFVFQMFNLINSLSVFDNVVLAAQIAGKTTTPTDIANIMCTVGLDGQADRKPDSLSGGEQQRVSLARALLKKPSIILADEPTGNLDYTNSLAIGELLRRVVSEEKVACVIVTHNNELTKHADRVVNLLDGRIVA